MNLKVNGLIVKASLLALLFCLAQFAHAEAEMLLDKSGVALSGYDPVSYFKSDKPVKGMAANQLKQDGATYLFSSDANKQEFMKNPTKYMPQFGGWCAYAVADSKSKVEVDPESFVIQDGKLLLFYNGLWGNTRKKWLNTSGKDPKAYLQQAEANWPAIKSVKP